jgi:hypothetical protein
MMAALGRDGLVDDWQEIVEEYGRDYMTVGAARLRRELAGDLLMLRQHIADDKHPALRSAVARISVIYGMPEASDGDPCAAAAPHRPCMPKMPSVLVRRLSIVPGESGACGSRQPPGSGVACGHDGRVLLRVPPPTR